MSERDPYSWEIVSRDGAIAHQFEGDVEVGLWSRDWAHRTHEIAAITARPVDDRKPVLGVAIPNAWGIEAVYRWERRRHFDPNTGREWKGAGVLTIGWRRIGGGDGVYLHIDAEGNAVVSELPHLPHDAIE